MKYSDVLRAYEEQATQYGISQDWTEAVYDAFLNHFIKCEKTGDVPSIDKIKEAIDIEAKNFEFTQRTL